MNSEVNNNLTLSSVPPVKTETVSQQNNTSVQSQNITSVQPVKPTQNKINPTPTLDSVKTAADQSNPLLQAMKLTVEYSVDSATKEVVLKVVDTSSGKLIRQIPSAEMLDFVKRLQDLENQQKGAVIQTRA